MRAHEPATAWANRRNRRDEAGFTLVELLVVLIIIAILMATVLPQLGKTRKQTGTPQVNLAAGAVWRGVLNYRIDNQGELPPVAMLTAAHTSSPPGSNFKNDAQARYLKRWPSNLEGKPMRVFAGGAAAPTARVASTSQLAGSLVYGVSGAAPNITGYLVGYSSEGTIAFRRTINGAAGGVGPLG